jgi:hypothetical protein
MTKLTLETVENLRSKIAELPEVKSNQVAVSKQHAITLLKKDIETMKKKGYSIEQVAEVLKEGGIELSPATLKNYMHRATPAKAGSTKKAEPKQQATQEQAKSTPVEQQTSGTGTFTPRTDSDEI